MALIPRSVTQEGAAAGTILQYGHGLFGDKQEITYGSEEKMRQDANANGWILFASDWIGLHYNTIQHSAIQEFLLLSGLAEADEPGVADMLATDLSNFAMIPDKSTQGMLNALVLMRLAKTGLFHNKEFMYNGKSVIDPKKTAYMGNSQGCLCILHFLFATLISFVKNRWNFGSRLHGSLYRRNTWSAWSNRLSLFSSPSSFKGLRKPF